MSLWVWLSLWVRMDVPVGASSSAQGGAGDLGCWEAGIGGGTMMYALYTSSSTVCLMPSRASSPPIAAL